MCNVNNIQRDALFVDMIIFICFLFVIWQFVQMLLLRGKTDDTKAIIHDTIYANPNGTPFKNSKWAIVVYRIEGKEYVSQKRIQVPMNAQVGEKIDIKYLKKNPEKIVFYSYKKLLIGLLVLLVFIVVKLLLINGIAV